MRRLAVVVIAGVAVVMAGVAWLMYASLPVLDGERALAGLEAPVSIARDDLGVVTIRGRTRLDVARATGFAHAQDRLFQMDLLRRDAAGELAAVFGRAAVAYDRSRRMHRLRSVARQVVAQADPEQRALLEAYADGVNAGLASLRVRPPEYLLLGVAPQPWRAEDTVLVVHAMFLVLNHDQLAQAVQLAAAHDALAPEWFRYLSQSGTDWDAPLLGAAVQPIAVPGPQVCDLRLAHTRSGQVRVVEDEAAASIGSNAWAVAAGPGGGALVADDMHLVLRLPSIWYRMRLIVDDSADQAGADITGAVLPGAPVVVVGSNRHIAWGFTNSNGDWLDLVDVDTDPVEPQRYRTAQGWRRIEVHHEVVEVKNEAPQQVEIRTTIWGPLIDAPGLPRALRWSAHLPQAINMGLIHLERARNVDDAVAIAPRLGIPPQNFVVGDRSGRIAWTIAGRIPARHGFDDARLPASWADGRRGWHGWLSPQDYPVVIDPPQGRIWTANARVVDGLWLQRLGDGGYAHGARARQIRDRLLALDAPGEHDMLAIQLDDRALFMQRWRQALLAALSPDAIREHSRLQQMREVIASWHGRASVDAAGYRLVKAFRSHLHDDLIAHIVSACGNFPDGFEYRVTRQSDGALWRIVEERPAHLLPAPHASWSAYLLAAAAAAAAQCGDRALALCTWGEHNTVRVAHPLSHALPVLGALLDIEPAPMNGDSWVPRVQRGTQGASQRFAVSPGREEQGYFHMPGGQSGHPLSRWYRAGHDAWLHGEPLPFLPGEARHRLTLRPRAGG